MSGKKYLKKGGVALAAGPVAVVTDGFQRNHENDIIVALAGRFGIDHAAHLLPQEKGRLLVDKGHETDGDRRPKPGKKP